MSPNDRKPPRRILEVVRPGSRPPGVPVVPAPEAGGSLRFDPESLDRPTVQRLPINLSPAAIRLLGDAVGDLAESMGGSLTTPPSFDPAYLDDGKASICLVLTVRVADLNRVAAERATDSPRDPQTAPEAIADATDGSPVGWTK